MRVFIQFSFMFTEVLLASVELVISALLLREYFRRRSQRHLLFMGVSMLLVGLGNFSSFFGDFFNARGAVDIGETLASLFYVFVAAGALFYSYAFISIYAKVRTKFWYLLTTLFAIIALIYANQPVSEAFGQYLPAFSTESLLASYGYWFAVMIITSVVAGRAYIRHHSLDKKSHEADRMLMLGGLLSIAAGITIFTLVSVWYPPATSLVYIFLTLSIYYKFLGAAAKNNPDKKKREQPKLVLTSSLTAKVLVACGIFYALLSFALTASITNFFVNNAIERQNEIISGALHTASERREERRGFLVETSEMLAAHEDADDAVTGDSDAARDLMRLAKKNGRLEIMIADQGGEVLFSSSGDLDYAGSSSGNQVIMASLRGSTSVDVVPLRKSERKSGMWHLMAASAVYGSDGSAIGSVAVAEPFISWELPAYYGRHDFSISGCGMVSYNGEVIASSGKNLDALTLNKLGQNVQGTNTRTRADLGSIGTYFVEGIESGDTSKRDFLYVVVSSEDLDAMVLRSISIVLLISVAFFIIFALLLVFGMHILLKPVYMLQQAAVRISKGDYDYVIEYESQDEVGQLANAFNSMAATIRERTQRLDEKIREQRDALSHTAHEIRTPLNIFRWSLEMLRFGDMGKLNDEQMELLEQMNQTNERIRKLVNDMLDVSRIEKGRLSLDKQNLQVEDLIDEVAGSFSVQFRKKDIDFYWRKPEKDLPAVKADPGRIEQVLTNLISNAVKFTSQGGHIEVSVSKTDVSGPSNKKSEYIKVSVKDNGRGIPKKEQSKIFGRFFRVSNVVEDEIEGTGLGLYLSKQYVEMHGGEIWFDSKRGVGSTFYFTLPIQK